jgi:hypothetical protein
MAKRFYLHIGLGKCGSTYLQNRLRRHEDLLCASGVRLSQAGLVDFANHGLSELYQNTFGDINKYMTALSGLQSELQSLDPCTSLIASSEYLYGFCNNSLPRIIDIIDVDIEVMVIVFLRRQDRLVESWYCQDVRYGNRYDQSPIELARELSEKQLLDYYFQIQKLIGLGDNINVTVFSLEHASEMNIDIFNLLLNSMGVAEIDEFGAGADANLPPSFSNARLPRSAIILLKHIRRTYGRQVFNMFSSSLPDWFLGLDGSSWQLNPLEAELVVTQNNNSNQVLSDEHPAALFDNYFDEYSQEHAPSAIATEENELIDKYSSSILKHLILCSSF